MKEKNFIEKNKSSWNRLEYYLDSLSRNNFKKISSNEVEEFLYLFRSASHHLAYVRTHYPDSRIEKYLNTLVGNAHHLLYAQKRNPWEDFKDFVLVTFPKKFFQYRSLIFSSFAVFLLGMMLSFFLVVTDISYSLYFIPQSIIDTIDYSFQPKEWDYALMSSLIMINNITVSLRAFVYGLFLGIGTLYILFLNGGMLGALTALVYLKGDLIKYSALILPHGILELAAIFVAGATGLLLGKTILLPGKYKRLDAVIRGAKEGVHLLLGAVLLLVIAALIEGFFTPLPISPIIKLVFAFATLAGLLLYLYPSRGR